MMAVGGGMKMKGLGVVGFGVAQLFWSGGLVFDRGRRLSCLCWVGGVVFDRERKLFWICGLIFDRGKQISSNTETGDKLFGCEWQFICLWSIYFMVILDLAAFGCKNYLFLP